jgi:hypothetical protein
MQDLSVIFAYFGPETVMPMTSVVATIAALCMMFGRSVLRYTLGWVRTTRSRIPLGHQLPAPHFAVGVRRVRRRVRRLLAAGQGGRARS